MPYLKRLSDAASELARALEDPLLGSCLPALPNSGGVVLWEQSATPVTSDGAGILHESDVQHYTKQAVALAAKEGAVLVVGFLGHGFQPGSEASLYFMVSNSIETDRLSAVDVGHLLVDIADTPGLAGLIAIVDTCNATGSVPSLPALTAGIRGGRIQCDLLVASGLAQAAYDMRLSRELANVIRTGLNIDAMQLSLSRIHDELIRRIGGQDVRHIGYQGDPLADEPLWIAHNDWPSRSRSTSDRDVGWRDLGPLLEQLGVDRTMELIRERNLIAISDSLARETWSPVLDRARQVTANLILAAKTKRFLEEHLADKLSTGLLRRAMVGAGITPDILEQGVSGTRIVDYIALNHPAGEEDGRKQLAKFVVHALLASEAQNIDVLQDWARSASAVAELNDALEARREYESASVARLIISLHASVGGQWPDSVHAWLLVSGSIHESRIIQLYPSDRAISREDTESALIRLVDSMPRSVSGSRPWPGCSCSVRRGVIVSVGAAGTVADHGRWCGGAAGSGVVGGLG